MLLGVFESKEIRIWSKNRVNFSLSRNMEESGNPKNHFCKFTFLDMFNYYYPQYCIKCSLVMERN